MAAVEGFEVAVITITKTLTDDDVVIRVDAVDSSGDTIALVDALGMLEFGKQTLLLESLGYGGEDVDGESD